MSAPIKYFSNLFLCICSNVLDLRNLQKQFKKYSVSKPGQNLFRPFTVQKNCSSDLLHRI